MLNNEGGGIFRILPGNKNSENFDTYFETIHQLSAKPLCEMHDFEYTSAKTSEELSDKLSNFFNASEKPRLLEIFTPRKINDEVLLEYFNFMKVDNGNLFR